MTSAESVAADVAVPDDASRCVCGSGEVFGACCLPLFSGAPAPTAERLMRSRYTAFALGNASYLHASWHPSTRPRSIEIEPGLRWRRLAIVDRVAGGPFDRDGIVEFEAFWQQGDQRGSLRERSRFVRTDRHWFYVDGEVQ